LTSAAKIIVVQQVTIETNRYSVPAHLMGRALTARIHPDHIDLFADQELVRESRYFIVPLRKKNATITRLPKR
jgi:hypothetical protein